MNHVIIYGSKKDRQIGTTLHSLLEQCFSVNYLTETSAISGTRHFSAKTQKAAAAFSAASGFDTVTAKGAQGCHLYSNFDRFSHGNEMPGLNLIETNSLEEIEMKNGILLLKSSASIGALRHVDKSTNVIVNSGSAASTRGTAHLGNYLPCVYTCGFNSKDFVTFSSRDDDNAVVSLQRGIRIPCISRKQDSTLSHFAEPFEIPCLSVGGLKDYTVLSSILVLILLGVINENKSKKIGKIYF